MFKIFLSFLALYRLKGEIGYASNLPILDNTSIIDFINRDSVSVIFYVEPYSKLDFADVATERFVKSIDFARSLPNNSRVGECEYYPCLVAYKGGHVIAKEGPLIASGYIQWLEDLVKPKTVELKHQEDVRLLFNECGSFVIGIDTDERPKNMKDNEVYYTCSSRLMMAFNIKVNKGVYVYRSADRMLVRAKNNYKSYLNTPITDVKTTNLSSKKYIAGYFMESFNKQANEIEMEILRTLAGKFQDIHFFPITGGIMAIVSELGRAEHLLSPLFAILPSGNGTERWMIHGDQAHDVAYLSSVIQHVLDGDQPPLHVSEENNPENKYQLTYDMFDEVINNSESDVVVAYVSSYMRGSEWSKALMPACDEIINSADIKFYVYNLSVNDIPENLDPMNEIKIIMYPKGSEEEIMYFGSPDIKQIIGWICEKASTNPQPPKYSPAHYMNNVLPSFDPSSLQLPYVDTDEENKSEETPFEL